VQSFNHLKKMATVMVAFAMIVSFAAPATIGVASASHNGDLSHDAVISADQNGNVYVYDGGQLVLETSVGGGVDHAEYDSTNNQIVLWHADANGNSTVTAISPSDGSQIWQTATSGTSGSIGPEHAYVTSQNSNSNLQIEKVDLGTGELVETHTISELGNLQQAEYVPGSGILVGHEDVDSSSTSTLAAIDAGTGSVQWTHSASGYIYGSAVNADGQYVYTMDGVGATVMLENTGNGYSEAWNTTSASGDSYQPAGVTFTSDGNVVVESTDSMGADDVYELSGSDGSEVNAYTASNAHYPQPGTFAADGNGTVFGVTGGPPTDVTTFDLSTGTQGSSGDAYSMSTTSYTMTTVYESMNYQTTPSTYTISGTVTDASGTALADASLTVTDSTGTQVASTTTASDGSYSVNVTGSDDYTVEVSASGYTSASKTQTVSSATTMDFSLEQASYSFSATVEDSSGSAIDGATVELLDSSDNVVSSGTTASDGTISLSAPSGSYDVQVSASGYDSATGTADLSTSGDSGTFQLAQSTFTVNGTVTDSSDNALENASVTLLDSSGNTVKEASTASDGTYSISGVKSGKSPPRTTRQARRP